jgi:single-strand DNA-binding protein
MINNVTLVGRLARDPELKKTNSGKSVCSFSVAVSRDYKDAEGNYPTDFINCVAWEQRADYLSQYAHKGDLIGVIGSWETRKYESGGETRTAHECKVKSITILSSIAKKADTDISYEEIF